MKRENKRLIDVDAANASGVNGQAQKDEVGGDSIISVH